MLCDTRKKTPTVTSLRCGQVGHVFLDSKTRTWVMFEIMFSSPAATLFQRSRLLSASLLYCVRWLKCVFTHFGSQVSGMTTRGCWSSGLQISRGPWTRPSGDGEWYLSVKSSCNGVVVFTVLPQWLAQIRKEDLHPPAWGARPRLYVQAPSGRDSQQPHRLRFYNSWKEDGWILGRRYFYNSQRCSHAACTKGPVGNTLQTGTSFKMVSFF